MITRTVVVTVVPALLFGVAWWGDRKPMYPDRPWLRPVVYSLALAVYCSSWTFYGAVGSAVRNGTKKANVLRGTGASDRINGKGGNDRINGKGGIDCLDGGPGKDRITGGAGRDRITAGAGNDRVFVKDGATDRVNCGAGRDRVIADPKDKLTKCEIVRRP